MLSTLSLLAISVLCYYVARTFYNIFLHPLASIPGPMLAAASSWYETYFDLLKAPGDGGRYPWEIKRMHRVYGPIVRIGPNEVHVDDPAWFETFKPLSAKRDRFAPRAAVSNTPLGTFGTIDNDLHRARKAVITPFFSRRAVAEKQFLLHEKAHDLCEVIREDAAAGRATSMENLFGAYSLHIICEMVMGLSENVLRDREKATMWRNTLGSIFEVIPVALNFPFIMAAMQSLPASAVEKMNPYFGFLNKFYTRVRRHAEVIMKDYHAREGKHWDPTRERTRATVFHAILESALPLHEKSLDRLEHEGREMIGAGGETTTRILCAATYYILATPGVLDKLKAELKSVYSEADGDPELSKLESLPWLTAIIKETLRLRDFIVARQPLIAPGQTLQYDKYKIPPGTGFSMDFYTVMHDPSIFPQPREFCPERWLQSDTRQMDKAFVVFGRGPRICSGKNLAWAEAYVALATVFGRFELELHDWDHDRDFKIQRDMFQGFASKEGKGVRVKVVKEL